METNCATFAMVQRYPDYRVLPFNHPCVNNTRSVYIDRYDSPLKFSRNVAKQKSQIRSIDMSTKNYVVPQPFTENTSMSIEGAMLHDMPREIINNQVTETKPVVDNSNAETIESKTQQHFGRKTRFTGDELLSLDLSHYVDLLEDFIPSEEISVLAGSGGVGKSGLYLHFCILLVLAENEFIGRKINSKNNSVLIVATEDNEKRLSARIKKMHGKISPDGRSIKNLVVITSGRDLIKTIRAELEKRFYDIVVIDALTDILDSDHNSPTDVRKFYNEYETLIREFQTTILFVTHVNKSNNKNSRFRILGSTAIVDRARSVIMMEKDLKTGLRTLTIEKSNNISDDKIGKPIKLKFDSESLTFSLAPEYVVSKDIDSETPRVAEYYEKQSAKTSPIGKPTTKSKKGKPGRKLDEEKVKQAFKLSEEGYTLEEIGEFVGKNKATICRWLKKYKGLC